MKQTAIQELIQEFEQLKKIKLYEKSFKAIDDCVFLALNKLEMEKENIIDAHKKGFYSPPFRKSRRGEAEDYYNKNFKL